MAKSNKANAGNIIGLVGTLAGVAVAFIPVIDKIADRMGDKSPEKLPKKETVIVPPIYGEAHQFTISDAEKVLSDRGLAIRPIKLPLREASVKYRNCFDSQVVDSEPKPKQKAKIGDTVLVWYITQDVIDESQKIFDEDQKQKCETKQGKVQKRIRSKRRT